MRFEQASRGCSKQVVQSKSNIPNEGTMSNWNTMTNGLASLQKRQQHRHDDWMAAREEKIKSPWAS